MNAKSLFAAGIAAAAMAFTTMSLAQDAAPPAAEAPAAQQPAPAAEPQRNWLKVCDPLENGQRACVMRQVVVNQNNQFVGSFLLRDDPGQENRLLAVAAVPLGVILPFGVTWQIDSAKPFPTPFMLCDLQSCATQIPVNELFINSLKKGSKLTLTARNAKNEPLVVTINLAGFTAMYDSETAMTFDEFAKQSTGEAALEKILQDRAEAARQKLSGDGTAPAPTDPAAPANPQ
jgi:invasion protein IalB